MAHRLGYDLKSPANKLHQTSDRIMAPDAFFILCLLRPCTVLSVEDSMRGDPCEKCFVNWEMLYSESGSVGTKDLFSS